MALPPGFRFHPTDEELINCYLKNKISSSPNPLVSIIAEIDLYKFNPWELPGITCMVLCVCIYIYLSCVGTVQIRHCQSLYVLES